MSNQMLDERLALRTVNCNLHILKRVFQIPYMRRLDGNKHFLWIIKSILGHERMETTEMYVELFSRDLQIQHGKFSPVEHLINEFPNAIDKSGVSQYE